ncbi:unnamed protein product [Lymnaea stagnalis]|uniref:Uncharacterized protein n=1 Tax=Lymnaea stagnalis TaxID=6523 RepID=A0AAV2I680_LYMST
MAKDISKRRQVSHFQTIREDPGHEISKKPNKNEDSHYAAASQKEAYVTVSGGSGPARAPVHAEAKYGAHRSVVVKKCQTAKVEASPPAKTCGAPAQVHPGLRHVAVHSKNVNPTRAPTKTRSGVKDGAKLDVHALKKTDPAKQVILTREDHVTDAAHVNPAFEDDDGFQGMSLGREDFTHKSSLTWGEHSVRDTVPQGQMISALQTPRDVKVKNSPEHAHQKYKDPAAELSEIVRYKDINYGACYTVQHIQPSSEFGMVDVRVQNADTDPSLGQLPGLQQHILKDSSNNKLRKLHNGERLELEIRDNFNPDQATFEAKPREHDTASTRTPRHIQFLEENRFTQPVKLRQLPTVRSKGGSEEDRPSRPHSRSLSLTPYFDPEGEFRKALQASSQSVGRSQSMRVSSTSELNKDKPKKLLRELSFSDADATAGRNYGALRGRHAIPRRQCRKDSSSEDDVIKEETDQSNDATADLKVHLLKLMQELLVRGKVQQVAILEQDSGKVLVSLPPWTLSDQDSVGLVKAVSHSQEIMLKLTIGREVFTCFKHGRNKMVGRHGDKVLVAQETNTCVVVGLADDDTPGSCLYEVTELSHALMDKDW